MVRVRDRLLGAGVVAFSLLTIGGGLGATGIGMLPGLVGQIANAAGIHGASNAHETLFGNLIALASLIRIPGGIGIWMSQRWGFVLTAILSVVSLLLGFGHLAHHTGLYGIPLNAIVVFFCLAKLGEYRHRAGESS